MNAALSLPRGGRHPTWYVPLLLPIVPVIGAYGASDSTQFNYLLGAVVMLVVGLAYSFGLIAVLDRLSPLARKEAEQLKPAWLLGLFAAQLGLLFGDGQNPSPLAILVPPLMYALVASLTFGIEFQQRTMPTLLCAPVDRSRLWWIKMDMLGGALASIVAVLGLSALMGAPGASTDLAIYLGISASLAFAAWATVPFWTLLTRNLLAGLVFAFAVPPLTLAILAALLEWITPAAGPLQALPECVVGALAAAYTFGTPIVARRRWLNLEAPDQPEMELSGLFLSARKEPARTATARHWFRALAGKELRLQSVTLVTLGIALVLSVGRPLAPQTLVSQELISLLIGLFSVVSILLAGATSIAEERRLGTLDGQVLLPVSRNLQWLLKLAFGLAIAGCAGVFLFRLVSPQYRTLDLYFQACWIVFLFIGSFHASSATPNALRALLYGLAFSALLIGVVSLTFYVGMSASELVTRTLRDGALSRPQAWLDRARALSASRLAELQDPTPYRFLGVALLPPALLIAALPFVLALRYSHSNFRHPSAAPRSLRMQFLTCTLTTLLASVLLVAGFGWLLYRSETDSLLRMARQRLELEARLSPAQLQLYRTRNPALDSMPDRFPIRLRTPSGGIGRTLPPGSRRDSPSDQTRRATAPASVHWVNDVLDLPLGRFYRARVILDGDIPEDVREALRREAIAEGDTTIPPNPGKPPGPWPGPQPPGQFQMSPELMKRYGLIPTDTAVADTNAAAQPPPTPRTP